MIRRFFFIIFFLATAPSLFARLHEEIIFIQSSSDPQIEYETTIYTPIGKSDPLAPVVIINHGTNPEPGQGRERAINPVKYFLDLGFPVILPMRRGYSNSSGEKIGLHNCNLTRYGLENA